MNLKSTSLRFRLTASALLLAGAAGLTLGTVGIAAAATPAAPTAAAAAAAAAGPVTVINSVTDPAAAAAALKQFDTATNKAFTPSGDPTFADTGWASPTGTSAQENDGTSGTAQMIVSLTNTLSSSWSVGGSLGVEAGAGALGFANASVSLKLTAGHNWETTVSDTETITANVDPGKMVWILESHSQATYTGTYTFTAADGINYQVTNVTITKPASRDGNPLTAASYRLVEAPAQHSTTAAALSSAQLTALSRQLGYIK